ncbi:MAG: ABC transporter ATP-binding protein [Clostridiales bacterium]|nr:ABC transporter ATP-binding protein [Clostridiales bacterium]
MKPYHHRMLAVTALMLFSAAVDVVLPLFQTYAIRAFIEPGSLEGLWPFAALYVLVVVVQTVIVVAFARSAFTIEMCFGRDLKRMTFEKLQKLSFSYYNKTPVGTMLSRVLSDTDKISMMVAWGLIDFMWSLAYVAGILLAMLLLSVRLAAPILLIVPVMALLTLWFQRRILAVNRQVRRSNARIVGAFNEGITGAKTSKTLCMEDRNTEDFRRLSTRLFGNARQAALLGSVFAPLVLFFGSMATAIVLWQGGILVRENLMDFAVFSVFITYSISLFEPVQQLARIFADFVAMQANIERVEGLLEAEPDVQDRPDVIECYGDCFCPRREHFEPIVGDIAFEDVSFHYGEASEMVLHDFSLQVKAGTLVAVVGETGAGKSTLVNLLCRFFEPTSGRILIDGVDYRERSQLWLHSNLGYVLQSPHLFSGTIADNIRYGKLDATDEEVRRAAELVAADRVALRQEQGYDFDVGEGGDRLSTGEKQLISFARAVIADPAIFVLDEATSSIDTETEQLIQGAIERLLRGRTSFVIAHRLSTIRRADLILVMQDGRVVERGTHAQLLRKRGYYHQLYTEQYTEQAIEDTLSAPSGRGVGREETAQS